MPGRGPAPKPDSERARRNKRPEVTVHTPTEPRPCPDGSWTHEQVRYWDTWAASPQASAFLETDWQRLELLLPMVEQYLAGDMRLLTEIRLTEERWGALVRERQSVGIKVTGDAKAAPAAVEAFVSDAKSRLRALG